MMSEPKGYVCLVLHAHLPYVRHPEHEHCLEERWFYEAVTETYIPLVQVLNSLSDDGIDFRLTISLSPTLLSMFNDELLMRRYARHLEKLIELAEKELARTRNMPEFHYTAQMYEKRFTGAYRTLFGTYRGNLISAFRQLQATGKVELITTCATHGYLPLLDIQEEVVKAQVAVGMQLFELFFGRRSPGIWLPECAYKPGHDQILKNYGIRYFFTDTHGIMFGSRRPRYGVYAPVYCPSGVAAFGRDVESSKQVWSSQEGYPGDPDYREFYRDIGYDLDYEYIKDYIHPEGIRYDTGIKYYRITGRGDYKEPYQPDWAREKAALHAGNFMFNRERQIEYLAEIFDRKPIVVAPYDAELFGHWWFEGPDFLNYFIRKAAHDQKVFRLVTASEYLDEYPVNQVSVPNASSWGHKGYNEVWLEKSNEWIYRHLHKAGERMVEMANNHPRAEDNLQRMINQAARELLLAQASDWAFIMKTGTMVDYAVRRTKEHINNFTRLYYLVQEGRWDEDWLRELEARNNLFPFMDYRIYASNG